MAKTYTCEMFFNQHARILGKYPWKKLRDIGDRLIITGEFLAPLTAQASASAFGKRHDIKIATHRLGDHGLEAVRLE